MVAAGLAPSHRAVAPAVPHPAPLTRPGGGVAAPTTRPATLPTGAAGGERPGPNESQGNYWPDVRVRLWCDQNTPVAVGEMTFGVRCVGQAVEDFPVVALHPPTVHWPRFAKLFRDGARVPPRPEALPPPGPPQPELPPEVRPVQTEGVVTATLHYGETRELTFRLDDAVDAAALAPGLYLLYVDMGPARVDAQAVQFEVWDEKIEGGTRRMAKVTAQGLPVSALAAKRPTTQPAKAR